MNINTSDVEKIATMIKEGKADSEIKNEIFTLSKKAGYDPLLDAGVKNINNELAAIKLAVGEMGGLDKIKEYVKKAQDAENANATATEKLTRTTQELEQLKTELKNRDISLSQYKTIITGAIDGELATLPEEQKTEIKKLIDGMDITKQLEMVKQIKKMAKVEQVTDDPLLTGGRDKGGLEIKAADKEQYDVLLKTWGPEGKGYPEEMVRAWFLGKIPALPITVPKK